MWPVNGISLVACHLVSWKNQICLEEMVSIWVRVISCAAQLPVPWVIPVPLEPCLVYFFVHGSGFGWGVRMGFATSLDIDPQLCGSWFFFFVCLVFSFLFLFYCCFGFVCFCFVFFVEKGFLCVSLALLLLVYQAGFRLKKSACFCLPRTAQLFFLRYSFTT